MNSIARFCMPGQGEPSALPGLSHTKQAQPRHLGSLAAESAFALNHIEKDRSHVMILLTIDEESMDGFCHPLNKASEFYKC